jgi:hypothetical protein
MEKGKLFLNPRQVKIRTFGEKFLSACLVSLCIVALCFAIVCAKIKVGVLEVQNQSGNVFEICVKISARGTPTPAWEQDSFILVQAS